jgi:hypothetical protein
VDNSGSLRIGPCHTLSETDMSFCQMILCCLSWGKNLSLRNAFSLFICLLNADLEAGYVLTLCPVTAYYKLQSKLHLVT